MAKKKISRKELLQEPDEFLSTTTRVLTYIQENPRTVTGIAALIVVGILLAFGAVSYHKYRINKGHELFAKAYRNYSAAMISGSELSPEKLDGFFREFDQIAKNYGSLLSGEQALLYSGHVLYQMKDYKGALERYERMKSTKLAKKGLGDLIIYNLGMTRIALGEYEQAKDLFEQLAKIPDSPYGREAYAAIASIYEAMGKNKEAIQAYRQYLKMYPQAPDAAYVKTRISELATQG